AARRTGHRAAQLAEAAAAIQDRDTSPNRRNESVRSRVAALRPEDVRRPPYPERVAAQAERLPLPALPTTTIGSFPQTGELRAIRAGWRAGRVDDTSY